MSNINLNYEWKRGEQGSLFKRGNCRRNSEAR